MSTIFKPGDTVTLKSGGHPMTVCETDRVDGCGIFCEWTDERGEHNIHTFYPTSLAPIIRKAVHLDEATIRHIWVFAETGQPIADHIAYRAPAPEKS